MARLIFSFGKYAYGENETTGFCHMYADGEVLFDNGIHIICKTNYPYEFDVTYEIINGGQLAIRIPAWSKVYKIIRNGKMIPCIRIIDLKKFLVRLKRFHIIHGEIEALIRCASG